MFKNTWRMCAIAVLHARGSLQWIDHPQLGRVALPHSPLVFAGTERRPIEPSLPLGARNDVFCHSIEHKLGIHGSPTCVMLFEEAKAELVGTANQGLAHMFVMMNAARFAVGLEGLALSELAYLLRLLLRALGLDLGRPVAAARPRGSSAVRWCT